MKTHLGILLISLGLLGCQASRSGAGTSTSLEDSFGASGGSLPSLDVGGGQLDALKSQLGNLAEETGDPTGTLSRAKEAADKLGIAYGAIGDGITPKEIPELKRLITTADNAVCLSGVNLFRAGYEEISSAFFSLCDTKWVFEARHGGDFVRSTQSDDLTEIGRLITKWGYSAAYPVYRVFKAARPYDQEPTEIASEFFPSRLKPLFRCFEPQKNYYFMTTDKGCEGAAAVANPVDPMGTRRLVGYLSAEAMSWTRYPVRRLRNLGIPNDLATIREDYTSEFENQGYENLGVLGFSP